MLLERQRLQTRDHYVLLIIKESAYEKCKATLVMAIKQSKNTGDA